MVPFNQYINVVALGIPALDRCWVVKTLEMKFYEPLFIHCFASKILICK